MPADRTLYRWIDSDGKEWACGAYDHGPLCRLCQQVDGTFHACLENVEQGRFEWQINSEGEFRFRLTAAGTAAADQLCAELGITLRDLAGEEPTDDAR